jgi:hypothetical protein
MCVYTLSRQFWCYQNHQHTLKMGTDLVPETSANLHILTRLSAQDISLNPVAATAKDKSE